MQNSLNQAFIRAYAKEREAAHAQAVNQAADSQAAVERANEDLILRIDTTTVEVPLSHLSKRQPARHAAALPAMAATDSRVVRTEADELRATIASEMLRAGGWQSEQIASLGPISSVAYEPTYQPLIKPMVATIAEDAGPRQVTFKRDAEFGSPDSGINKFFSRQPEPSHAPPDFMQYAQSGPTQSGSTQSGSTQSGSTQPGSTQPGSTQSGSIVRLDKPLGTTNTEESQERIAKVVEKPVAVASQPIPQPTSARANPDPNPAAQKTAQNSSQNSAKVQAAAEAKQVEQALRRAKVRIFNPIWEVDKLQWPEVCVKLMDARLDSLTQVTKHLMEACQEGLQVLAVTSPEGGEGRTTVACCLAMLAGSRGLKVAIVDGDIENPTLCLQTNLEIENDWQSAILNHLPLEEVSVHSIEDQVTLVPLLGPLDQYELPSSDMRIADMLLELAESFDLVILDIGHMNSPNGLMQSLAEQGIINAAIAVVDHRNASPMRIETCIRRIRQAGINSIGLVENFAA